MMNRSQIRSNSWTLEREKAWLSLPVPLNRCWAARRSCSALRTHCPVSLFIENFAPCHDFFEVPVTPTETVFQSLRCANDQIEGEPPIFDGLIDADSLLDLVPGRHHHKQVHIAIGIRRAAGIGTEKDNSVRMKAFGDLPGVPANCR